MKVEDPSALLVQWVYHKSTYLPKGDESSWQNCIKSAARSATTKWISVVTEKINMDIRSTNVGNAGTSLPRKPQQELKDIRAVEGESLFTHPLALFVAGSLFCTMTRSITPTTHAATRNAAIQCSFQSLLLSRCRLCPNCSVRRTSNGCATLSMWFSWP